MVMGSSKILRVFNFAILLKSRHSLNFDAHKIYMFYSVLYKAVFSCVRQSIETCILEF